MEEFDEEAEAKEEVKAEVDEGTHSL